MREAERLQIWRPLGMVSVLDYVERVLGYTPHVAKERLRVAHALGELPALTTALANGALPFAAIRELTRVATPATEGRWLGAATGKNVRQIEELVSGHRRGDDPDDALDDEARVHVVRFVVGAEVAARLRQARAAATDEHGSYVDDERLLAMLTDAYLDRVANTNEPNGRAKFQIALSVCPSCDRARQEGGGVSVPIDAAALERARCDAQHVGSIDGDTPERAHQDIPPSVVRFVWRRDGGRCQTPGCRSSVGIEIHHLTRRADGGTHEPINVCLACSGCHMAIHRGTLSLWRNASGAIEAQRVDTETGKLDVAITIAQARDALVGLGWKLAIARAAVDEAQARVGPSASVELMIREALRRCPKPAG